MSDYIYHIGDDYDCINKEYVILSTDKGQQKRLPSLQAVCLSRDVMMWRVSSLIMTAITRSIDGTEYKVTSHVIGDKDINDVMLKYAEDRAMSEMLGSVPSAVTA